MPAQVLSAVENNFTKGLLTEFTGLNFPENAATDTENCTYTLIGDVTRRLGIDLEVNNQPLSVLRAEMAMNSYKWNNAGGDGETQVVVTQIGQTLYFYVSSNSTAGNPLSTTRVVSTINVPDFTAQGNTFDPTAECTFADGNGYLFVYHTSCDPFFCSYNAGVVTGKLINIQIRDFVGLPESVAANTRLNSISQEHYYNLINQGWTAGAGWVAQTNLAAPTVVSSGTATFTSVTPGLPVTIGEEVAISTLHDLFPGGTYVAAGTTVMSGSVNSYSGTTMTVNINGSLAVALGTQMGGYNIIPTNVGYINTWSGELGNYPSNSDVWWYFKDNTGTFNPAVTVSQVTLNSGQAPQGHIITPAFNINRTLLAGVNSLTITSTTARPTNGAWFAGRVWYTGVNAFQPPTGDADYYTWTENLYFSNIVQTASDFGNCYQTNDPTSETLFGLLPTDGGVINIQGAGAIYKLFPIQNGMLVFAANGVWFITGSQGIGFTANDYTITKISAVQSISSTSFVDVLGLPYFWNEEGVYAVKPNQGGGLVVEPITVGTIESFYDNIPTSSKRYVRGAYHPINYEIQWVYCGTESSNDVTTRYNFDSYLCYNTYNQAFFPYSISNSNPSINGIIYVSYPGGLNAPDPGFKYLATYGASFDEFTFADEHDTTYVDWASISPVNYVSYFVTGFRLRGQGQRRFQMPYIYVYSRNEQPTSYYIQGLWDYAISGNSGRWSVRQQVNTFNPNFGMTFRRHRIRGHGLVLQIKVSSTDGMPFDIMGWSTNDTANTGV